jgi:uncharacterized 2Fe-2S/4Fe-4S cluster protein (DUF4445 family)
MRKEIKRPKKTYHVIFQPSGKRGEISAGKTLIDASRELGAGIESVCGGERNCGRCKVRIENGFFSAYGISSGLGHLSAFEDHEDKWIDAKERASGYRLACAARIRGDVLVFVPEPSRSTGQVVRKDARDRSFPLNPAVTLHAVELSAPTIHDPLGDLDRLKKDLVRRHHFSPSIEIDYPALVKLPAVLRQGKWNVTVAAWMKREIIDIIPGKAEDAYGLAVDIGTTTVAAYLCHLSTGKLITTETMMNPQIAYGEDVMSRIGYVMAHPDGLEKLHTSIIAGLNGLIRTLTGKVGLSPEHILDLAIVGNTAMHHLFLKITPEYLGTAPFPPALHPSMDVKARELGVEVHPAAYVHVLPVEAGFVGADNVGVLIAERPHRQRKKVLIIDVGTNGELVLGNRDKLLSTSCATGPALEGAHITFGMRAAPGAIERIRIDPETFDVTFGVIGHEAGGAPAGMLRAKGICGSGIIDGIAELFRTGGIDATGRFRKDISSPRFRTNEERTEFVIAWKHETSVEKDITITQQDVRNVQLAKAALYTGAKLMMRRLGIKRVEKVILAGAFGSYIDPMKAMLIGMFPDCEPKQVYAVGNAAGDGARMALLNLGKRREADGIAGKVEYVELTIEKDFQKEFLDAMAFPHKKDPFPHLKGMIRDDFLKR